MSFEPDYPQRLKVYSRFMALVQKHKPPDNNLDVQVCASNIERSIFNNALSLYSFTSHRSNKTWNIFFKNIYINRAVSVYVNLDPDSHIRNNTMMTRLLNKQLLSQDIGGLSFMDMFPEKYKDYKITIDKMVDIKATEQVNNEGMFKCFKCNMYKTTYYQMQTRSADEPLTTFITCHNCDKKWKIQ